METIAILIPCTSKNKDEWKTMKDSYLYNLTLKTFLYTQTKEYNYVFYIGYDEDDRLYGNTEEQNIITKFEKVFHNISFKFISMKDIKKGHLTVMWNRLYKQSYDDGCSYFFQCGDDIKFHTENWVKDSVSTLKEHNDIGITGPMNNNAVILTQCMVSRKHMQIFGYFFPSEIINWCCDDWYNIVYSPDNFFPLMSHYCSNEGGDPRYVINNDPMYVADLRANTERLRHDAAVIAKRDRKILLTYIADVAIQTTNVMTQMSGMSVIVCGCTKNSAHYIADHLERLYGIKEMFADFHMVIYENDSTDKTTNVLSEFKKTHGDFHYISETLVLPEDQTKQHRPQIIAHGRNTLMRYLETMGRPFDYTIMVDLDSVVSEFDPIQMTKLFTYPVEQWDGLTANCRGRYYDIWALRISKDIWDENVHSHLWRAPIPYDCWVEAMRTGDSNLFVRNNQVKIPNTISELIPVESSFGGFAIYRSNAIVGCRYSAIVDGALVCEHVAFHHDMKTIHDAKLAICPGFVMAAQPEHMN